MRYFLFIFLVCAIAFAATFGGPAFSQRHIGYCDQANSTADTLDCIKSHNDDTQAALSATFKAVIESQDQETRSLLSEAQKNWLIYRDAQCDWETGLPAAAPLKRVYELSCLTAMTERRLKLLQAIQAREEEEAPREFGTQPRWMNALASDYPDIFWRYGRWESVDLNCDGAEEQVMTGIAVAHILESVTIDEDKITEDAHQHVELVVAVSDNPQTGRPKSRLFRLPVAAQEDIVPRLCRPAVTLETITRKNTAGTVPSGFDQAEQEGAGDTVSGEQDGATYFCEHAVRLTDKLCPAITIFWDGQDFVLEADAP